MLTPDGGAEVLRRGDLGRGPGCHGAGCIDERGDGAAVKRVAGGAVLLLVVQPDAGEALGSLDELHAEVLGEGHEINDLLHAFDVLA